ncbi:MAG TPA: di-heme oxidoredictase family protein [Bryobacteraceae bacterium]|nr:di-heme oxidoredictase family protein [Bryobacteraceae bacterium]
MKKHYRRVVFALAALPLIVMTDARAACPAGTACDPGPRPVGQQAVNFSGPVTAAGDPLLKTPIANTRQPADAIGNEGAGQVLHQAGTAAAFWFKTIASFGQVASVDGAVDSATGNPTIRGLGPSYNGTSCFSCHAHPAIGGSSPGPGTPGFTQNPQLAMAKALNAANPADYSSFLTPNGPVREVRFIVNETDPSRRTIDGGVHGLFTVQGRSDAPAGCLAQQPDIVTQLAANNAIFRIPTPTFGLGLIENVSDADLIANAARARSINGTVPNGVVNRSGNDGTVARFGWKAQNKSLLLFSAEAANVEMGITNEIFPNERAIGTNCSGNAFPEDETNTVFPTGQAPGDVDTFVSAAIENFTAFMRFNGAPAQCDFASGVDATGNALCNPLGPSAQNGRRVFERIGCNACHTESFTTQASTVAGLSNRTFQPFSDFALHHMGSTLADGVTQGLAGPDQFRTAPLWGVGQRLFLLHDGRTADLKQAILAHSSPASSCFTGAASESFFITAPVTGAAIFFSPATSGVSCGSDANGVVQQFNQLTVPDQQDLLNFLRSL